MPKSALVLLATGFEEIEATCPIDLLRRADVAVTIASCEKSLLVSGRSNIKIEADCLLNEQSARVHDALVIPGGPGVFELRNNPRILSLVQEFDRAGKIIGAICAAPLLLLDSQVLRNRKHTAHGSASGELPDLMTGHLVVHDENLMTSRGAGTAVEFGLSLISALLGKEKAKEIACSIHAEYSMESE